MKDYIYCFLFIVLGGLFAMLSHQEPKVIYKVVNTPPTDQQLIDFWFGGNQDQVKLRNRICK